MPESDISQQKGIPDRKATEGFFQMYREPFLPAYSDLVAITANKPSAVLFEIENAFFHLMKYSMSEDADMNLRKAKGHIYRASVDSYKLLWEFIHATVYDVDSYRGAYEGRESDLLQKLRKLSDIVTDARLTEAQEVGSESDDVLILWKNALEIGLDVFDSTNKTVLKKLKRRDRFDGLFTRYVFPVILCVAGAAISIYGIFFT